MKCSECQFFRWREEGGKRLVTHYGNCHRFPASQKPSAVAVYGSWQDVFYHVQVAPDDWCGEFQVKTEMLLEQLERRKANVERREG